MGLKPDFRVLANSQDITTRFRDRLIDLRITDEVEDKSDSVSLQIDDRDHKVIVPPTGANLEISLGYDGILTQMGAWSVDEIEISGPPYQITIRARSANFSDKSGGQKNTLRESRNQSWDAVTVGDIVSTIAGRNGYASKVAGAIAATAIQHIDQTDESDLHFLTRLAKRYDAVAKPAGNQLIFVPRGAATSASGKPLTPVFLAPRDVTQWRYRQADRGKYASVEAYWHDAAMAQRTKVTAGSGSPIKTIQDNFPTAVEAKAAAESKLESLNRTGGALSLTLPGNAMMAAGATVTMNGFRSEVSGAWKARRVEHQLNNSGYNTRVECEST